MNEQRSKLIDFSTVSPMKTEMTVGRDNPVYEPLSEKAKGLRILLLEPLYPAEAVWAYAKTEQGYTAPMGMISVYSYLKNRGYNVDLIDTQFGDYDEESLKAEIASKGYDVVALSVYTPTADYAFQSAALAREALPNCKIVMGNIHVTTLPKLSMDQCPELDFIIRHEAEFTFDEFLVELADGDEDWKKVDGLVFREGDEIVINKQRPFIGDLDDLPVGFFGDLDLTRYVPHPTQYVVLPNSAFLTQRGCPYSCSYCEASLILGKKTRFISPERVVEELKIMRDEKGIRGVYFQDSTFTINRKYIVKLMDEMIKADLGLLWSCNTRADRVDPEMLDMMYQAGGRQIVLGIESGNQESLDLIMKGTTVEVQTEGVNMIRKAGFRFFTNYILGLPGETEEMVHNTIKYAKSLAANTALFYLPVPYPGSALYQSCKADGGMRREARWQDFLAIDPKDPVYVNPNLGVDGMIYWYNRAFREYYTSPKIVMRNLLAIRSKHDVGQLMRGGRVLFNKFLYGTKADKEKYRIGR